MSSRASPDINDSGAQELSANPGEREILVSLRLRLIDQGNTLR